MATKNKSTKPTGDTTRTDRANAYLERLAKAKGKRLLVDLDEKGAKALSALLKSGYGETQKEVVINSLLAAHKESKRKV